MLTVLSGGYPFAAVSPDAVGGAEQILASIDAALVRAGMRSIVVAPSGSRVAGELHATTPPEAAPYTTELLGTERRHFGEILEDAVARYHPDVVHLHGADVAEYLPEPLGIPIVVTLHLWPTAYPPALFASGRDDVHLVCVSDAQRAACPASASCRVIRNGIDLDRYGCSGRPQQGGPASEPYVLLLGRLAPEKGFHLAIDAARAAGLRGVIAGAVYPYASHQAYFSQVLQPRFDDRMRFVGPVGGAVKRRWLGGAACLAVPSIVPETSSLVAMEALASHTPVVAFSTPALNEIVDDGRTGFLVHDVEEMRDAFARVGRLERDACRPSAEARCAAARMTGAYIALYAALGSARRARCRPAPRREAVRILTNLDDIRDIAPQWARLWTACPDATPFQHPAWLLPWLTAFPDAGAPALFTMRRRGELVAVVPLVDRGGADTAHIARESTGTATLAGAGISDYLGGVIAPEEATTTRRHLEHFLSQFGVVRLEQLREGDPLLNLTGGTGQLRTGATTPAEPCPVLRWTKATPFDRVLPPQLRSNLRYYRRRLDRRGAVTFDVARGDRLLPALEALFHLHAARWRARGGRGVLAQADLQAFHRDAVARLHAADLLALHTLRLDDRVVAAAYCLETIDRTYYYLGGFDPELGEASPGTLLLEQAVARTWRRGATAFDFLRGRESYKYLWGARDEPTFTRELIRG